MIRIAAITLLVSAATGCWRETPDPPPPVFVPPPPPDRAPQLEAEVARLQVELVARESRLQEVAVGEANLTQQIEDLSLVNTEMSERLRMSSQTLEQLAAERARLTVELEETKTKLRELDPKAVPAESELPAELPPASPPTGEIASVPESE